MVEKKAEPSRAATQHEAAFRLMEIIMERESVMSAPRWSKDDAPQRRQQLLAIYRQCLEAARIPS